MRKAIIFVLLSAIALPLFSGDFYIEQKSHTDPMTVMGQEQPAQDSVQKSWIGDNKFAQHSQEMSFIFDKEKESLFWIMHGEKSYVEMKPPYDLNQYLPEQMAQMMGAVMSSIVVTVTPKEETKKIGDWNCAGYQMDMTVMGMTTNIEVWATVDVPFDWKMVNEELLAIYQKIQMRLNDAAMEEMKKIQGYWVSSETTVNVMQMKIRSITEVVEISQKDAPAGTFDVPEGYTKQDKLTMQGMGAQ